MALINALKDILRFIAADRLTETKQFQITDLEFGPSASFTRRAAGLCLTAYRKQQSARLEKYCDDLDVSYHFTTRHKQICFFSMEKKRAIIVVQIGLIAQL